MTTHSHTEAAHGVMQNVIIAGPGVPAGHAGNAAVLCMEEQAAPGWSQRHSNWVGGVAGAPCPR